MSAPQTVRFNVSVTIDRDVWQSNYGTDESVTDTDIADSTHAAITEHVRQWLDRTGNVGTVDVIRVTR